MTSYGGTIILQCSSCQGHISHTPLASGNTFGARYWTDGWRDAPMLPEDPWLVKCPHCSAFIWIDELQKVFESEQYAELDNEYADALGYIILSHADYLAFIDQCSEMSAEKECFVRMRAWWRGNDSRRQGGELMPLTSDECENLRCLLRFMDQSDGNDRLMSAEIYRQLAEFESAAEVLKGEFSQGMQAAANQIRELTDKNVCVVAELKL